MSEPGEALYRVEGVCFRYHRDWVLQDIDLTVDPGAFIGVLGPNGSGKTSLLKIMAGLLQPERGRISLLGRALGAWTRREMARAVGVVPQESFFLYSFRVLEVVLMGRWAHLGPLRFEGPEDIALATEMLSKVDLNAMAGRSILDLSGGERQRAVIARALVQQPRVLLLDEPTAFLDPSHQVQIYRILKQLNEQHRLTIILVSHDLNLAAQFCRQVIMLKEGRVVESGESEQVIRQPLLEHVYGCRTLVDRHPTTGKPRVTLVPE